MNKAKIIAALIVAVAVGFAAGILLMQRLSTYQKRPIIDSFTLQHGELVVTGSNLQKVDIMEIPTGSEQAGSTGFKIGIANQGSDVDGTQTWVWPLPNSLCPIFATAVFARGYNTISSQQNVAIITDNYLSYEGPDNLNAYLCAQKS